MSGMGKATSAVLSALAGVEERVAHVNGGGRDEKVFGLHRNVGIGEEFQAAGGELSGRIVRVGWGTR